MAIIFDGTNRLIRLDEAYSVAYITSRWKDWVLTNDNAKYPPAFTDIAGNPISATVALEVYTFIRNDLGWRIQPFGSNGLLEISGEIYATDINLPFDIAPEIGDYAFFRFQGSSRTQSASSSLSESDILLIQNSAILDGKAAYIDVNHIPNTTYPEGSVLNPFNNLEDAVAWCELYNVRTIKLKSNLTIDRDLAGYELTKADGIVFVTLQGFDISFTSFTDLVVSGQINGAIRALRCSFLGCTGFQGFYRQCGFTGTYVFAADQTTRFNDCFEGDSTGSFPTFDLTAGASTKFSTHNHSGSFNLIGLNNTDKRVEFGLSRGEPILDNSCTDGDFILSGQGKPIQLNGATCNIDITGYTEAGILATNILNYRP